MSEDSRLPVTIKMPDGEVLSFEKPRNLQEWVGTEVQLWRQSTSQNNLPDLWRHLSDFENTIQNLISNWQRTRTDSTKIPEIESTAQRLVDQIFKQNRVIYSKSPEGLFLQKLGKENGQAALMGAYSFLSGAGFAQTNPLQSQTIYGMFQAFLFSKEVDWSADSHRKRFSELTKTLHETVDTQEKRLAKIAEQNDILVTKFEKELIAQVQKSNDSVSNHESKFNEALEKHTKKLNELEDTYNKKLALQKPVEYWSTKAKSHRTLAIIFGAVSLLGGVAAGCSLVLLAIEFLSEIGPNESPEAWQIGVLLISAFFAVWIVRVFVRLFLSNLHLSTDAAERKLMIQTFVTMAREGTELAPDDRKLILQHLFRSASDGLVKDDAAPPFWMNFFQGR